MQESGGRIRLAVALDLAEDLVNDLDAVGEVCRFAYAASLRRMKETIGDIDLLVAAEDPGDGRVLRPTPPGPGHGARDDEVGGPDHQGHPGRRAVVEPAVWVRRCCTSPARNRTTCGSAGRRWSRA
jgi:hypothetical protein